MMSLQTSDAGQPDTSSSREPSGWLPWRRRGSAAKANPARPTQHEPPARVAHHEAERRRRMAASAGRPLERTLAQATQRLFESVVHMEELATRAQPQAQDRLDAATLHALHDRLNAALQGCDQLAILVDHLQRLLEPQAPIPRPFDLRTLLSQAVYCTHGLLPAGLDIVNRVPPLAPVQGDRAEIMQAVIDALLQGCARVHNAGRLELHGGDEQGIVWIELRVTGPGALAPSGLALESAIETLARHRGALELSCIRDGAITLRMRLPAAR